MNAVHDTFNAFADVAISVHRIAERSRRSTAALEAGEALEEDVCSTSARVTCLTENSPCGYPWRTRAC